MPYRQRTDDCRQKLVREGSRRPPRAGRPEIDTLEKLHYWLQQAIKVEHFTIPPYLCAMYSLKDGASGPNAEAYNLIRSVALEEMLHLVLAANVLNAVGGKPRLIPHQHAKRYPAWMPHSAIKFQVDLLRFSKGAINTFLRIERPAERIDKPAAGTFWSIGEMYEGIREAMHRLDREAKESDPRGIFTGDPSSQITDQHYYGSGGKVVTVVSLNDAESALDEIVGQGEGVDGTIDDLDDAEFGPGMELAHYFRFNEIFCERRYRPGDRAQGPPTGDPLPVAWDAVYNMVPNPTEEMFAHDRCLCSKIRLFNDIYSEMLRMLHRACNGQPYLLSDTAVPQMYTLRDLAVELMNERSGIGDFTAGPSFEYHP